MQNLQINNFIQLSYHVNENAETMYMIGMVLVLALFTALFVLCCVKCYKYRKESRFFDVVSTVIKILIVSITTACGYISALSDGFVIAIQIISTIIVAIWDIKTYKIRNGLRFAIVHMTIGNILGRFAKYVIIIALFSLIIYYIYCRFISDKKSFKLKNVIVKIIANKSLDSVIDTETFEEFPIIQKSGVFSIKSAERGNCKIYPVNNNIGAYYDDNSNQYVCNPKVNKIKEIM